MVPNGVKISLPLRVVVTAFAAAFLWYTAGRACFTSYASAHLAMAAADGQVQEVLNWLDRGANINTQDGFGDTPLMMAARNAHPEAVRALLSRGANDHLRDHFGLSAAHWAHFHLHDSQTFRLPDGFDIRQVPRPDALQTIALLNRD